jgi:hypothetical protein
VSAIAQLFFGIAAIITALFTGITGIVAVTRGSTRERRRAARGAVDRILGDGDSDDDDGGRDAVIEDMLRRMLDKKAGDDDDS